MIPSTATLTAPDFGRWFYLGRHGQSIVILLSGESKKTQATDIKTAKDYWADWKLRQA